MTSMANDHTSDALDSMEQGSSALKSSGAIQHLDPDCRIVSDFSNASSSSATKVASPKSQSKGMPSSDMRTFAYGDIFSQK